MIVDFGPKTRSGSHFFQAISGYYLRHPSSQVSCLSHLLTFTCQSLVNSRPPLLARPSFLATRHSILRTHHSSLVTRRFSLDARHSSPVGEPLVEAIHDNDWSLWGPTSFPHFKCWALLTSTTFLSYSHAPMLSISYTFVLSSTHRLIAS